MGVDINTYRCRVGTFLPGDGCGFMSLFITFDRVVKLLGSLTLVRILLLIAGVEQNPGPADKYIFRYQYLLVEIGTAVMRKIFDVKVGSDFVMHLSANNNKFDKKLQSLISAKIITADQAQHLPPVDNSPQTTNFDITLLACLLRNVCCLRGHKDPVWKNPPITDLSLEAELARLKECRNNLQHIGTIFISEADLTVKWNELSQILNRLNTVSKIPNMSSLIFDAQKMDIDEELKQRYDQAIKACTDMDNLCDRGIEELRLGQYEIKDGQSAIKDGLSAIKDGQSAIIQGQSDIKYVQSEIKDGQSAIKDGKSEIIQGQSEMKYSQSEIRKGQSEIKDGQSAIKDDQSEIIQGQSEIKYGQSEISKGQSRISKGQSEIKHGQSEIRDDQSVLKVSQTKIIQGQSYLNACQAELKDGQAVLRTGQSEIKLELKDMPVLKKSVENIEKRQQEQAEHMREISNTQKRQLEQTPLDCKRKRLDMESDLRNRLVQIYKEECCTLPVSPLCDEDEDEMEILSIYKPPSLYHVHYHRTQEKEEKYSISSYKEIFVKDDHSFRKIYITGDAGVGKTSFCKLISFLWCKSQCGESVSDTIVQNDIDFMAKFDVVFYISLRETKRKDVVTMIIEQLFCNENDLKKKEIYECIENILKEKECIIILDGLDEWIPNESGKININRLLSDKCIFVTTCRPYKIENERLSPRDLDRQVQITGINDSSIKRYVTEIINHISKANRGNKHPDDFIRDVVKCGLQEQLCIPIITSHLVAVWLDHKLTDMSRALIYSNIVDMLFKRAEKRKDIELPSSTESEVQFPDSLSGLFYFKKHISFLKKICLLSFNVLFKQDKCLSELVFTTEQLESEPYCVSGKEMDFLCKFGILSKNKVIGRFGKRVQKLSYLHKTYLEYFAALYVSSFDLNNEFDNVAQIWTSINDVVQFDIFFIFFAGLAYRKSKFLFENIYHTLSYDLSLCRYNALFQINSYLYYIKQIKSLQTIVLNCFISFKLEDFVFDSDIGNIPFDLFKSYFDNLKQFLLLNRTSVKAIHSVDGEYYDEFDQIKNLQCLTFCNVSHGDYAKFTECMLQNQSTLHTVCIQGCSSILIPELPVRSIKHLTSLSLSYVKMEHNSLHNLVTFLSDNVLIEDIILDDVSCDNHYNEESEFYYDSDCTWTLNLPHHTKLTSLYLCDVNFVCNNVNNSSLKYLKLIHLSKIMFSYIDVFNCIKYSQLEHLDLNGDNMLDDKTMKTLTHTVNTLPYIKSLTLQYMTFTDDVLLQLHPDVTQVKIKLVMVSMSRQCFHGFIEHIVTNKSVIKIVMALCDVLGKTPIPLACEESLDYMSKYITTIPTINITCKDGLTLHFETISCQ